MAKDFVLKFQNEFIFFLKAAIFLKHFKKLLPFRKELHNK